MTLKDYLQNSVSFNVPELAISCILELRGGFAESEVSDTLVSIRELSLADVLMYGATAPTSNSGAKDSDGGWSHTEGSITMSASDKSFLRQRALAIYKKYGESVEGIGIKIQNLNGERFHRGYGTLGYGGVGYGHRHGF